MKPLLKSLFIPAMLILGACCGGNNIVMAPVVPPAPAPAPAQKQFAATPQVPETAKASQPLPIQIVLPGLGDVFYDFDKSELNKDAVEQLKANANWIAASKTKVVIIEGHCDERGTNEYNLALGDRRAKNVRNYIMNLGIAPDRLKTVSYGEEKPYAVGSTEEAWAQNRRVHFVAE
jgi:peptidoglycan-associated lipoprotein